MEIQIKKSKQGDPLMDILDNDLPFLVLQHLNGSDMLKLSEVSPQWNKMVAERTHQIAGDKIRLTIKETSAQKFYAEVVTESLRKYRSLRITRLWINTSEIQKMLLDPQNAFEEIHTCYDVLLYNNIQLPNVKILSMTVARHHDEGLLNCVQNLTKLRLDGRLDIPRMMPIFIQCLNNNSDLKEMVLDGGVTDQLFAFPFPMATKFALESFKCNAVSINANSENNMIDFLRSQSSSLKEIKLLHCPFFHLVRVLKVLPNICRVTFSPIPNDYNYSTIATLRKVVELNLIFCDISKTKELLKSAPNLKDLYIAELKVPVFRCAEFNLPCLKTLRYAYVDPQYSIKDFDELYENDKKNLENINQNIKLLQI